MTPREIAINLPMPPSVNRIWRRGKGKGMYLSDSYAKWQREAADLLMVEHWKEFQAFRAVGPIAGPYEMEVTIRKVRGDLDNRLKVLGDFCQKVGLVADDKYCEGLTVRYGEAPHGCRLVLRSLGEHHMTLLKRVTPA